MSPETTIIRSKKRKRTVALHIEADGTLVVTAPMRTSLSWINSFIREKTGWIARRRADLAARKAAPPPELKEGCLIPFLGAYLILSVSAKDPALSPPPLAEGLKTPTQNSTLHLDLPPHLTPDIMQAEIKTELVLWYKKQARRVFAERIAFWADRIGVHPARLMVSNPQKRWGSCSARDEIRLNWRLVMASYEILDYVVVHELCHIPHKNHGQRFWALVERFIPDARKIRQELRNFEKSPFPSLFA